MASQHFSQRLRPVLGRWLLIGYPAALPWEQQHPSAWRKLEKGWLSFWGCGPADGLLAGSLCRVGTSFCPPPRVPNSFSTPQNRGAVLFQ